MHFNYPIFDILPHLHTALSQLTPHKENKPVVQRNSNILVLSRSTALNAMPINAQCYHALVSHILILLLLLLSPFTNANCECGYTVNSTLYTDLLETDFLHLASLASSPSWQPQNYTVTPALARGPFGKNASLANVVANPLKNKDEWAGEGVKGGDAGLQLWVKGGVPRDGLVGMAEVTTVREDLLFGTWRVGMKTTGVGGTCGAFFWVGTYSLLIPLPTTVAASFSLTEAFLTLVLQ